MDCEGKEKVHDEEETLRPGLICKPHHYNILSLRDSIDDGKSIFTHAFYY